MDHSLYIAASGAKQIMQAQAVNANNLANASTTGFQADLATMRSMPVFGPGHASRVYAMAERPGVDFAKGAIQTTGRELDIAVNGEGWIAVQAHDGSEAYTRAGNLRVSSGGILETAGGLAVLSDAGPILVPEHEKIEIAADGTISVLPIGQDPNTLAVVSRIKLVAPQRDELFKGEDGLLRTRSGAPLPGDAQVRLVSGALESSNVNAVQALIGMIELARQYETQVKLMETTKQNDEASARLMNIAG